MTGKYHSQITTEALSSSFNISNINYIKQGNLDSDKLRSKISNITDDYNLSAQHFNKTPLQNCDEF